MFKSLSPGAIGIHGLSLSEAIELARKAGFESIDFSIHEAATLAEARGIGYVRDLFKQAGVWPGHWGLPVAWHKDDQWQQDLEQLPQLAAVAKALDCPRTATWCPSGSDERVYDENWAWCVSRFRPIAEVLKEHGCRLGIEFIGPQTFRARFKHPFVCTLAGMMELAAAVKMSNVGLLLDAWHLYTSGGSVEDLDRITAADVVLVHVNDAPAGVARDEQVDSVRCLPLETGVIDTPGLLRKLAEMGYDGPVMPEPFSQRINAIASQDPLQAAQLTAQSMEQLWQVSGLA